MGLKSLTFIFILFAIVSSQDSFYTKKSKVHTLNINNFDSFIKSNKYSVVEFFAPWCGHCQRLKPEYISLAKQLYNLVPVGAVNCDDQANSAIAQRYGIKGFPTIKIFINGKPHDYNGQRTADGIKEQLITVIPSKSKSLVGEKELNEFRKKQPEKLHLLLFSDKAVNLYYKILSNEFSKTVLFAEVRKIEKKLVEKYSVDKFPTLFAFKGKEKIQFNGPVKKKEISNWINTLLGEEIVDEEKIPEIKDNSCLQSICGKGGLCVVLFLPKMGTLEDYETDVKKYIKTVSNVAFDDSFDEAEFYHYGFLNLSSHQTVEDFASALFLDPDNSSPQLVALSLKRNAVAKFVGAFTPAGIKEFLNDVVKGRVRVSTLKSTVPSLRSDTEFCTIEQTPVSEDEEEPREEPEKKVIPYKAMDVNTEILENFIIGHDSSPTLLFFYSKSKTKQSILSEYEKASLHLKGMVKFLQVNVDTENQLAKKYSVKKDVIKVLPAGLPAARQQLDLENFSGEMTAKEIAKFAKTLIISTFVARLTGEDIPDWLQSSKLPPVFLFSNKHEVSPLFAALSLQFMGAYKFAQIHKDEKPVMDRFGVTKVPIIIVAVPDREVPGKYQAIKFEGPFDYPTMLQWFRDVTNELQQKTSETYKTPPPEELLTQDQFDAACFTGGTSVACLVAMLEDPEDKKYIDMLTDTHQSFIDKPIRFFWMKKSPALVNQYHLSDDAVIFSIFNLKYKRYSIFVGLPNADNVVSWIEDVIHGKTNSYPLKSNPIIEGDDDTGKDEL